MEFCSLQNKEENKKAVWFRENEHICSVTPLAFKCVRIDMTMVPQFSMGLLQYCIKT